MQSILQQRRFKAQVQQQRQRYKDRSREGHIPADRSDIQTNIDIDDRDAPVIPPATNEDLEASIPSETPPNLNDEDKGIDEDDKEYGHGDLARRVQSEGLTLGYALTGVDVRTRTNQVEHVFVVGFESPTDPMNPQNWPLWKKVILTGLVASVAFIVGWSSSITSAALPQASADFHVSDVTESLATGLFLIGFGIGGLGSGPISEAVGRNMVYIVTMGLFMIFVMASALAPNIAAQLVFRSIAGIFAATPLVCSGGSLSDIWSPSQRTWTFPIFANAGFTGPMLGPVVGGYVAQSTLVSWRWVEWITLTISGAILVSIVLFQPETYAPVLLSWKAAEIRKVTSDNRFRSEMEIRDRTFLQTMRTALYRPFLITATEPIIFLISLYLTVVYIIMFTFLNGFTFVFADVHGFDQGKTGLCFLGIVVGLCCVMPVVPFLHKRQLRELAKNKEQLDAAGSKAVAKLAPEERLIFAMLGAPAISLSLFWMAWTSYPSISPWSAILASVFTGFGILAIFISSYQYVIDTYEIYAASALASLTFTRYLVAGSMVVVSIPMYDRLGLHWTLTLLGALSALMMPVPFAFWFYGEKIRRMSKFSAKAK